MKNNQNLFVVKKFNEPGKNRRSINRSESDIKKEDINERNKEINKDLIISGNIIFNENADFVNKCWDEKDIKEKYSVDNNNSINTFFNDNGNKSPENYPHSSKNLNKIKKEGMYILYKYNLIIDKNNLIEGFWRRTELKRKNKEDYEKKCPKESREEGDQIKDDGEKMISDFMEKKRKKLLARLENKRKIIIDFFKEKKFHWAAKQIKN